MEYILAAVIALTIVIIVLPWLIKLAHKIEFTDKPSGRKKHRRAIPLIGGVGMFIGFYVCYFIFVKPIANSKEVIVISIASLAIILIGLVDDYYKTKKKEFPIYPRFIVQILAASLVFFAGVEFTGFTNPLNGEMIIFPEIVRYLLTITWIFGVTTVINWCDGMDGLAGGVSIISAITLFIVALAKNEIVPAMMSVILVGSITGFLKFNLYPAKVFMGDSGANFIGFILSIIALDGAYKQATIMSLFAPILALGIPIFDNIFVILKRYKEGKPVYKADRSQMHFRLADEKGMNTNQVVRYICLLSTFLSMLSILIILFRL